MTLVVHPAYGNDDPMIERLPHDRRVRDARVPSPLYAYLLPDDWCGHPSDAALRLMGVLPQETEAG